MSGVAANIWYSVTYLLPFLFVLGAVMIVHEGGHFLVARYFGITVEVFSIGVGPEIVGRVDRRGTKWRLAWIPFLAYVKFKGDENGASMPRKEALATLTPEQAAGNFHVAPLYQRAAVVFAGPLGNLILALIIFIFWFMLVGKPIAEPRVMSVEPNSPAEQAGIKAGDIIREMNDRKIESIIGDVERTMVRNGDQPMTVVVERDGKLLPLKIAPRMGDMKMRGNTIKIGRLGVSWALAQVGVLKDGAAEQAGLKDNDVIVQIDDTPIPGFQTVEDIVRKSPDKPLQIIVKRNGERLTLTATPKREEEKDKSGNIKAIGKLGVSDKADITVVYQTYGVFESATRGFSETKWWIEEPFIFISKLIEGTASSDQVGSVISIAEISHDVASVDWVGLFSLLAIISIQIGVLNLFPIPILDGGHLLFYGIEAIRGRPLSERAMDISFRIGISFMIMLMLLAVGNDVIHKFHQWG
jgi:regulator of sigma E protease